MTQPLLPILLLLAVEYTGVILAVLADLVTGLSHSRREGVPLTSKRLRHTVEKLKSYLGALLLVTLVDAMIIAASLGLKSCGADGFAPFPYLSTAGAIGLALIEVKSMLENMPNRADLRRAARLVTLLKKLLKL